MDERSSRKQTKPEVMPVPEGNMSQRMEESEESEGYIFVGRMDNARNLTNVLKAIHFKDVSGTLISPPYRSLSVGPTKHITCTLIGSYHNK